MEKQLLKRLALSALIVTSYAQAEFVANVKKAASNAWEGTKDAAKATPGFLKKAIVNPFMLTGAAVTGYAFRDQLSNAATTVGSYLPNTPEWMSKTGNTLADYSYRLVTNRSIWTTLGLKNAVSDAAHKVAKATEEVNVANKTIANLEAQVAKLQNAKPTSTKAIETNAKLLERTQESLATMTAHRDAAIEAQAKAIEGQKAAVAKLEAHQAADTKAAADKPAADKATTETKTTEQTTPAPQPTPTEGNAEGKASENSNSEVNQPTEGSNVDNKQPETQKTEVKDLPPKHIETKEEKAAAEGMWNKFTTKCSNGWESTKTAWTNNDYYFRYAGYGLGAGLATWGLYKAYNHFAKPTAKSDDAAVTSMKKLVSEINNVTAEQLPVIRKQVLAFNDSFNKAFAAAYAELGAGREGKAMKTADEIFGKVVLLETSNVLSDALNSQVTRMKDLYTSVKTAIEQWQKTDKKAIAPIRNAFLYAYEGKDGKGAYLENSVIGLMSLALTLQPAKTTPAA